jgi:hypothetical protein
MSTVDSVMSDRAHHSFAQQTNSPSPRYQLGFYQPTISGQRRHFSVPTEASWLTVPAHGIFFLLHRLPPKIFAGLKLNPVTASLALSRLPWRWL